MRYIPLRQTSQNRQRWLRYKPEWRFDRIGGRCHISGSMERCAKRNENCSRAGHWRERVVAKRARSVEEPDEIRLPERGAGMTSAGVTAGAESLYPHFPYSCGDKSCFLGPDSRNAPPCGNAWPREFLDRAAFKIFIKAAREGIPCWDMYRVSDGEPLERERQRACRTP